MKTAMGSFRNEAPPAFPDANRSSAVRPFAGRSSCGLSVQFGLSHGQVYGGLPGREGRLQLLGTCEHARGRGRFFFF